MTPILGKKYWLEIPATSKSYKTYHEWKSSVTGQLVTVQDIRLGNLDGSVQAVITYSPYTKNWKTGLMVPSNWLHEHKPNPVSSTSNFCKCAMDLLMHRGCQCGGV